MDNPLLSSVDLRTGQLVTTANAAHEFIAPYAPAELGGGTLNSNGFLTKAAETATDLLGLFGRQYIESSVGSAGADREDPVVTASRNAAEPNQTIVAGISKEMLIGVGVGLTVLTIAAVVIARR